MTYSFGSDVIDITIVQRYAIGTARLSSRIKEIKLQKPKSTRLRYLPDDSLISL